MIKITDYRGELHLFNRERINNVRVYISEYRVELMINKTVITLENFYNEVGSPPYLSDRHYGEDNRYLAGMRETLLRMKKSWFTNKKEFYSIIRDIVRVEKRVKLREILEINHNIESRLYYQEINEIGKAKLKKHQDKIFNLIGELNG